MNFNDIKDRTADREKIRAEFEELLRRQIGERNINLIAEEAGDDKAVWEHLKQEEEALGEFAELFGGRVVDEPTTTIAKHIRDERPAEIRHVDIRAPNAEELTIEQRDEAMVTKVMEILGTTGSVLVIVGEDHRAGVEERLRNHGLTVKSLRFPE